MPPNRRYSYHDEEKDKEFEINSFKKCVTEKRELDKFLEELMTPYIKNKKLKILDAPCGIGHISYFLSELSPESSFFGVDQTPFMIKEAKKLCSDKTNISFEVGDVYDLPKKFSKTFDITINWRTVSWIPYYDEMIKALIHITKDHIFLSSLFYPGDIDFEIKVRDFQKEVGKEHFNYYYNVYSYPKFEKYVKSLGVKNIESYDFDIKIDVPKPPNDQLGSYTVKLANEKRLQLSGAIVLFWKVIRIDL